MVIEKLKPTWEESLQLVDYSRNIAMGESPRCPRCGKALVYEKFGTSYTVSCVDEHCIGVSVRGI